MTNRILLTWAELEAKEIYDAWRGTKTTRDDPRAGANWIVALADRIKAERAIAAMQP